VVTQCAEKLFFNRVWEGKDQRHGQVCLRGVIPPVPTLKTCFNTLLSGFLPEASEVVPLHVIYQDVTESKAAYIGRGPRDTEVHTREYPHIYNFLANFQADKYDI